MIYIGIDPGKSGGIAWILDKDVEAVKMPATNRDLLDELKLIRDHNEAICMLEKVHSMPKQGVVSTFSFGKNVGHIEMALTAVEIPYDEVTPAKWQRALGCLSGGDKNVTKRKAQELFPSLKITHAIADALLIAEYARRTRT